MSVLLVIAAGVVSTTIPARQVDTSWRVLTASDHHRGSWKIARDDGTQLTGDWIVVNKTAFVARDMGGGSGPYKAIYFVNSTSSTVCSLDAARPEHLYCTDGNRNLRVLDGATLALPRGTTPLSRMECNPQRSHCGYVTKGAITYDVAPVTPTLAEEELLFERTSGKSIAAWLGASATRTGGTLQLRWTFEERLDEVPPAAPATSHHDHATPRFARKVVRAEAVLRIGPAPTQTSLATREIDRFIEDCHGGSSGGSCQYIAPTCTRRRD